MQIADFESTCRVCCKQSVYISLFDFHNQYTLKIGSILEYCTSVSVKENDELPPKICYGCFRELCSYYEFKKRTLFHLKKFSDLLTGKLDDRSINDTNNLKSDESVTNLGRADKEDQKVQIKHENVQNESVLVRLLNSGSKYDNNLADVADSKTETNINESESTNPIIENGTQKTRKRRTNKKKGSESLLDKTEPPKPRGRKPKLRYYLEESNEQSNALAENKTEAVECKTEAVDVENSVTPLVKLNDQDDNTSDRDIAVDAFYDDNDDDFSEDEAKKKKGKKPTKRLCKICNKILSSQRNLTQHMLKHTGIRRFQCDQCEKKFVRAEHLNTHKRIHTGEKPHKCDVCSKRFSQYAALSIHQRVHSGEKPYMCSSCGKRFSQSISLTYHMRTHTGETPFKCKICNKGFAHSGNLNIHMRFHRNERPFVCTMCGRSFVTSSHLTVHVKQHLGEKPHQCPICSKSFVRSQYLKDHMVIHSGLKPHACTICPKRYTQSSHLRRHMKSHG